MNKNIKLYQGDCLEIFDSIDDNSIDLILKIRTKFEKTIKKTYIYKKSEECKFIPHLKEWDFFAY